jgi:hypothetical protein
MVKGVFRIDSIINIETLSTIYLDLKYTNLNEINYN